MFSIKRKVKLVLADPDRTCLLHLTITHTSKQTKSSFPFFSPFTNHHLVSSCYQLALYI